MPHILILDEAIELLESKSAAPPTTAQANLMSALQAADSYAHGSNPDSGVLEQIEEEAGLIKGYLTYVNPPSDIRLQSFADEMSGLLP